MDEYVIAYKGHERLTDEKIELELIKRAVMIICRNVRPDGDLSSLDYEDACKMQEIYRKLSKGGEIDG